MVSHWQPTVVSLIVNVTDALHEGKLHITCTKLQINLKLQTPMTKINFHRPGTEGNYGLGSTIHWRYIEVNLQ